MVLLFMLSGSSLSAQTAVFRGVDRTTGGGYRGHYGTLGISLPLDGHNIQEPTFARGVGSQFNMPRFSFDPRFPLFLSGRNCCNPVTADGITVATGETWPVNARCGCGWYNRVADGVPMQWGITLNSPRRISLLMIDHNAIGRVQRLDVYEQLPAAVETPGSLGTARANGKLLDSQVIDLQGGAVYARWDVSGPVNVTFTPIAPRADNGIAVLNGMFLDADSLDGIVPPSPPTNLRVLP